MKKKNPMKIRKNKKAWIAALMSHSCNPITKHPLSLYPSHVTPSFCLRPLLLNTLYSSFWTTAPLSSVSHPSMACSSLPKLLVLCAFFVYISNVVVVAQVDESSLKLITDSLEWPSTMSLYNEFGDEDGEDPDGVIDRRSMFWHRMRYYISYGALSANRIPCPPRSGRSYYTHNCFQARGPVRPYTRGCSTITRCRR